MFLVQIRSLNLIFLMISKNSLLLNYLLKSIPTLKYKIQSFKVKFLNLFNFFQNYLLKLLFIFFNLKL